MKSCAVNIALNQVIRVWSRAYLDQPENCRRLGLWDLTTVCHHISL